jgi:hypothetical protein
MKPKGTKGGGTFGDQRSVDSLARRLGCGIPDDRSPVRNLASERGASGTMRYGRRPLKVTGNAIGGSGLSMSPARKPKKLPEHN